MNALLLIVRNEISCYCGPSDGGKYDFKNACPRCGTGAKRIDPISLPTGKLTDKIAATFDLEVIIPPRLVPSLQAIAPNCLRVVHDKKNNPTQFFQLIASDTLPRFGVLSTGWCVSELDPQCPVCKRDGYYNIPKVPLRLIYDKTASKFLVAETYECFGKSKLLPNIQKSGFASPYLIVHPMVQEILKNEKGLEFQPVIFD